uniref:Protein containing MFS domain n=1 Tax=Rhipicephalus zambeziensis TaxID=60191 RepID=A0A224YF62_9ACAR
MMASTRDSFQRSDDEEELVFDQTGLLTNKLSSRHGVVSRNHAANSGGRLTVARTVNLCLSFFGLGLCFAIPTATIQDLQKRTNAEADIQHFYTARYGGYIFGCLIGGFLFDWYNRQFLLFLSIFATSIGIIVMPFCVQLATLMACSAITGITMGFLDTGGNVWCLDLWGRHSAPLMQALHFCFALGALVAPLIAEPFLSPASLSGITPMHSFSNTSLAPETYAHIPPIGIHHGIVVSRHHSHATPKWMDSPPTAGLSRHPRSVDEPLQNINSQPSSFLNTSTMHSEGAVHNESTAYNETIMSESPPHNDSSVIDQTVLQVPVNSSDVESNDTSRIENTKKDQPPTTTVAPSTTIAAKKPTKPIYAEGPDKGSKWDRKSQKTTKGAVTAAPNSTNSSAHTNVTSPKLNLTISTVAPSKNLSSLAPAGVVAQPASVPNEVNKTKGPSGNATQAMKEPNNSSKTGKEGTSQEKLALNNSGNTAADGASQHHTNRTDTPSAIAPVPRPVTSSNGTTMHPAFSEGNAIQTAGTTKKIAVVTTLKPDAEPVTVPITQQVLSTEMPDQVTEDPVDLRTTTVVHTSIRATVQSIDPPEATVAPVPTKDQLPTQGNGTAVQHLAAETPKEPPKQPSLADQTPEPATASPKPATASPKPVLPAVIGAANMSNGSSSDMKSPSLTTKSTLLEKASPTAETGLTSWITQKFMENRIGKLEFVYAILGAYLFVVSVVFLAFLCTSPRDSRSRQEEDIKAPGPSGKHSLVLLSSLFFFLYMGMEAAVGELLQIYAAHPRGYTLTYVFWGSFAAARFLAIPIAIKVSCRNMLLGDLGICFLASVLLVAGADRMESLLWTGVGVLGVGMASVLPTSLAWLERHMRVTNRTASVVLLGAAFGEMALPFLASHLIEREPAVLVYVNVSVVTLCCLNFGALWLTAAKRGEKYAPTNEPDRSLYQLANLDDGDDQADFTLLRPLCTNGENGLHFKEKHKFSRGLNAMS